ncbi:MAG: TatD family hydrolase [Tannerella sp.]|jgi:TatD DNase family protein|nr:TatD family hydrolase [Tannerella sp.]
MIDTHCHIFLEEFDADRDACVAAAKAAGLSLLLLPNIDPSTAGRLAETCALYPDFTLPMMGLHPTSVDGDYKQQLALTEQLLARGGYCAVGEIGLDLHWGGSYLREQKDAFETQLRWSLQLGLPVSIHCRDAFAELFDSFRQVEGAERLRGVFHCFQGTEAELGQALAMDGFYLGVGGSSTYKNSKLPPLLLRAGLERLLLETDAPYLPPVPYRGQRNQPAYMAETAGKLAALFGLPEEVVDKKTSTNAADLFNLRAGREFLS